MRKSFYIVILISIITSCDKFETRGFITSYEKVNERFQQSLAWNVEHGYTEITLTESNYKVYTMGDSHLGPTENIDLFFDHAQDSGATATLMLGDITTGHEEDYDTLAQHLPSPDSLTYFALAGNHDLYFEGWQHFYALFGSSSYYFTINTPTGNDLFICLDSGTGTLGIDQYNWLEDLLTAHRSEYRFCSIYAHTNVFRLRPTASTNPMAEEVQAMTDLFATNHVDLVLCAHDHKRNEAVFGNTSYIILDALEDRNDDASYMVISVEDNEMNYEFVEL